MTLLAVTALGFFLGVRHATDADHVVAITTIVCRERSARGAMLVGALWGIGHTVTILLVGGAIVLFGLAIPPRGRVRDGAGGGADVDRARRDERLRAVASPPRAAHATRARDPRDLQGDGAAVEIAGRDDPAAGDRHRAWAGGIGGARAAGAHDDPRRAARADLPRRSSAPARSLGMMLLTTAMTLPIALAARRFGSLERVMTGVTGAISLAFGLLLIYRHMLGDAAIAVAHAGGQP